jgi:hypothetical protein
VKKAIFEAFLVVLYSGKSPKKTPKIEKIHFLGILEILTLKPENGP